MIYNKPFAVFEAEKEKIENLGEDKYAYSFTDEQIGYIAVYDGCGGMGAKKYSILNNRTGARIASGYAGYIVDEFYEKNLFSFDGSDAVKLHEVLSRNFKKFNLYLKEYNKSNKISGSLFKSIPTTASIIAIKSADSESIECEYIWAGDSRGYILDEKGICQITSDDTDTEEDAFTSLISDARMSNIINADSEFYLNEKIITVQLPAIIISATDGSFAYFNTPMEFEYAVLKSLDKAKNISQWKNNIIDYISQYSGDDFSMVIAVYGFDDFNQIKNYFSDRLNYLYETFIKLSENAEYNNLKKLWSLYSETYYRR